jgi:hypothetical protein
MTGASSFLSDRHELSSSSVSSLCNPPRLQPSAECGRTTPGPAFRRSVPAASTAIPPFCMPKEGPRTESIESYSAAAALHQTLDMATPRPTSLLGVPSVLPSRISTPVCSRITQTLASPAKPAVLSLVQIGSLIERRLVTWRRGCIVCRADRGVEEFHTLNQCSNRNAVHQLQAVLFMDPKEIFFFDDFSGCMCCQVPQAICNRWTSSPSATLRRPSWIKTVPVQACQFKDVLVPAALSILQTSRLKNSIQQWISGHPRRGGESGHDMKWLGRKERFGSIEGSYLCELLVRFGDV